MGCDPNPGGVSLSITADLRIQPLLESASIAAWDLMPMIESDRYARDVGVNVHLVMRNGERNMLKLGAAAEYPLQRLSQKRRTRILITRDRLSRSTLTPEGSMVAMNSYELAFVKLGE